MVHVKVLDAKNLRIADRNGFSDPYVKVSLGLQGSKKTAVKSKNLNPIWNEEFQFPISSWDLPNILVLHVLDKDLLFFHDSLGSVSYPPLICHFLFFIFYFLGMPISCC
jgi:Ca2+-dependent lipid-binding protein